MTIKHLIDSIAQKHAANGITLNPPASMTEIAEFEDRIGFSLPPDFTEFYLTCNGFSCIEDIFNVLPLSEIAMREGDYGANWFLFSEYMMYSDFWALRITSSGKYEILDASEKAVTLSLKDFLGRFLKGNIFNEGGLHEWLGGANSKK